MHDICAAYAHFLCPPWAAPRGGPLFLFLRAAPLLFFPAAAIIILPIEHGPDLRAFLLAGIAGAHLTQVGVAGAGSWMRSWMRAPGDTHVSVGPLGGGVTVYEDRGGGRAAGELPGTRTKYPPAQMPLDALPAKALENDTHQLLSDLETASKHYDTLQRAFRDCHFALRELHAALGPSSPTFTAPLPANLHTVLTAKQHAVLRNAVERLHNCTEDERVELEMRVADEQVPARGIATTILQLQPGSASGDKTSSMRGWGISSVGCGCRGEAATQCGYVLSHVSSGYAQLPSQVPLLQHLHVSHHVPFTERAFAVLPTVLRTLTMSHYYGLWTYAEPAVAFMAALVVCISTSSREITRVEASDGDGRHIVLPGCGGVFWCCGKGWGGSTPALDIARRDSLSALSPEVHHFPIKSVSEMVEHEKGDNVARSTTQNEHGDYLKDYGQPSRWPPCSFHKRVALNLKGRGGEDEEEQSAHGGRKEGVSQCDRSQTLSLYGLGTQRFVPFGATKAMIQKETGLCGANSDNGRVRR
ncbi:hypothetical protein C8J57DRAFT_1483047 [Mycena rebaudengoi]|nr:hypothetical protein C8J57DRAFT_1483047 [Mycena rebaudengoi]